MRDEAIFQRTGKPQSCRGASQNPAVALPITSVWRPGGMRRIVTVSITFVASLVPSISPSIVVGSPQEAVSKPPAAYDDADAYEVYSAILPQEWPWREGDARTLVIRTETEPYAMCVKPDRDSEKIVGTAITDYMKKNARKWLLQRQFGLSKPYDMVSSDELDTIFKTEGSAGWPKFYERHPNSGGWIELSAVGFNASKTIAVVYAGHSCGRLCGGGTFQILQKVDGKWKPFRLTGGTSCSWAS
jgi:hypothetical protein